MSIDQASKCLAIVPARGGSKGIPRKNLQIVAGRPLLLWTLAAVAEAAEPMRCVVTTDDEEIATVSTKFGAEVVMRPQALSTDQAPTEPALLHVLDWLQERDYLPHEVLLLQPTSPVRLSGSVDAAVRRFRALGVDSLVGVVEEHPFMWRGPTHTPLPLYETDARPRRQDLTDEDRMYRENGSIYITNEEALRRSGNRLSGSTALFVMDNVESVDVDTPHDRALVDWLLSEAGVRERVSGIARDKTEDRANGELPLTSSLTSSSEEGEANADRS